MQQQKAFISRVLSSSLNGDLTALLTEKISQNGFKTTN